MIDDEKFIKFILAGIRNVILASFRDTSKTSRQETEYFLTG
jgi:hypothetical protein